MREGGRVVSVAFEPSLFPKNGRPSRSVTEPRAEKKRNKIRAARGVRRAAGDAVGRVSIGSRDGRCRVFVDCETYLVVVEVVVLGGPLGHHPVHPVGDTAREPAEGAPVEAAGHDAALGLRGVVAAVAHVVADHGHRAQIAVDIQNADGVDADGVERVGQEGVANRIASPPK